MTTLENSNLPEKNKEKNPGTPVDIKNIQDSVESWKNKEPTQSSEQEIQKIVQDIVGTNISLQDIDSILSGLPIDKRMQVERMIMEAQRYMISAMSQEKYKQYLQAQFPSGVPTNVGEMALSLVTDTSEMYKNVKQEIVKTGIESSDHERSIRTKEQRIAFEKTQESEAAMTQLSYDLSHIV